MDAVFRIGIDASDSAEDLLSRQTASFLLGMMPVGSERKHHGNVLIRHTRRVQFPDNRGKHVIARKRS